MSARHCISTVSTALSQQRRLSLITPCLALILSFFMIMGPFATTSAFAQANPVESINKNMQNVESTFKILNRLFSATDMDDETLVGARVKYQKVVDSAEQVIQVIDEQSKVIADRLTEIGAPPDEGIVEPKTVTDARAELNRNKSTLAVTKTELEKIIQAAKASIAQITTIRQEAFTEAISKRTEITSAMLDEASSGISSLYASLTSSFASWFAFVKANKFGAAIASTFLSLVLALVLSFAFNRFFGAYLVRKTASPDYFTRVFVAFWSTILPSAAISIFLGTTYSLFSNFGIFNQIIGQITFTLFLGIIGLVFAWNFCRVSYSPGASQWRLINLPDRSARTMFWLTFSLFVIYAFDALFTTVNAALSGPLSLTVLQGVITSLVIGAILIWMAVVIHRRGEHAEMKNVKARIFRWDIWISLAMALSALTIIVSALLGYIGFARFLAQQIVVTGGILAIMYVGIIAARELSREGVLAATGFGRAMLQREYEPYRVEQVALIAGLSLIALILLIGIPAILMQWGTRFEEITAFAGAIFTGYTIGGFRLSLSGVLVGLLIFGIILALTRLFQGWLARSVFPRSKIDPGVSDSIRAGIGYAGFAVAALVAVTSAGFDLSSLAIVAGALSLGIGFGLQNIVSNFVSGLILLVERPIKVGDWISVGAAEGFVKRISVRATEIQTFQNQSIIVPNSELINSQVNNWTFKTNNGRCDVLVGIAYDADSRLAERILYEIAHEHAMVQKKPEPRVMFLDFGPSSLDFRLQMHLYDILNVGVVGTEVRFQILERFKEAGIEIPFPQQDVNLRVTGDEKGEFRVLPEKTTRKNAPGKRKAPAKRKPKAPLPLTSGRRVAPD